MTSDKSVRFIARVAGVRKRLLTIERNKKGDIFVCPSDRGKYRSPGFSLRDFSSDPYHGKEIKERRYTVHPSNDSPRQINSLTHTIKFMDGSEELSIHYTNAIKNNKEFAPLFFRRSFDLSPDFYKFSKTGGYNIDIGIYDPTVFALMYMVLVSSENEMLPSVESMGIDYCNYKSHIIGDKRITFVYTFFSLPAGNAGFYQEFISQPQIRNRSSTSKGVNWIRPSLNSQGVAQEFQLCCDTAAQELVNSHRHNQYAQSTLFNRAAQTAIFGPYGDIEILQRHVTGPMEFIQLNKQKKS